MADERVLAQIYGEIERINRRLDETRESLAFQHTGSGAPTHEAAEGVFYWDYTGDALYVNSDGGSTWQSIGGGVAGAHVLLSATHTDTTAAAVARGSLIIGLGATPTWTRRDHPGGVNYYLRSNAADPDWTDDLTLTSGHYVGVDTDTRIRFVDGALIDVHVNDTDARFSFRETEMQFLDSGGSPRLVIRNHGDVSATGADIYGDAQLGLAADTNVYVFIDADNTGVDAKFAVAANQQITTGVTNLFTVDESGNTYGLGIANYHAAGVRTLHSEYNISNPPTDAELDAAFGQPATVGEGFFAFVDDNDGGLIVRLVASVGGSWRYSVDLTKAV